MSYEMYEMAMVGCEEYYGNRPFEVENDLIEFEEADDDFFFDGMYGD